MRFLLFYGLGALATLLFRVGFLLLHWSRFIEIGREYGRVTWRYKVGLFVGPTVFAAFWPIVLPLWVWHLTQIEEEQ